MCVPVHIFVYFNVLFVERERARDYFKSWIIETIKFDVKKRREKNIPLREIFLFLFGLSRNMDLFKFFGKNKITMNEFFSYFSAANKNLF